MLESDEGDPFAARALLERALRMQIARGLTRGALDLNINLGHVASDQYDFAAARSYLEQALTGSMQTVPDSANIPFALSELALTFYREGDLASALDYESRALARLEERTQGESLDVAQNYAFMGEILRDDTNFGAATKYFHRALDIRLKLAPESVLVSDSLVDLASLERTRGNLVAAIDYDRRALKISQKACPNRWCAAGILNDLGQLAYKNGDLATAEGYLRDAVDLREKSLGPMHPDLARSLNDLALVVAASGSSAKAREMALRAEGIGAEHLRLSARTLSERQALAYEGIRASGLDVALSLGTDGADASSAGRDLFDAVIRSRALVFDELAARHRSAYGSGDPEVAQLADQLLSARRKLATLVFRGVGDSTPEAYRKRIEDAREHKEEAERILAEKSVAFREDQIRTQLGFKDVALALPPGSALVAFVRFARYDFRTPARGRVTPQPTPSYAAFVLRSGEREPEFVRLGLARQIENEVAAWRRDIARQSELMEGSAASENASRRVGAALRPRIWDPLRAAIGDAREVFVVPDAALHLVSLASLPVGSSGYLVETGPLIHYLSTERDLVPSVPRSGEGILVVGNPSFDRSPKLSVALNRPSTMRGVTTGAAEPDRRGTRSACGTFKTLRFPPLPASEMEVEDIAALWKSATPEGAAVVQSGSEELLEVTGAEASTEAFEQSAPGKRVLHVATHGFFLEGTCDSAVQRADADKEKAGRLPATAENPLLLSGLAFAGANRRSGAGPDESDGILTAEEIAGLNLQGVDWAVLSACDTGVGKIRVGEGVFGLRRAFQVAGAKTVIMSLWPIEDETTRQWMATLYSEHFRSGKDTPESVRAATLKVLRQRRANHQSTHPFYWGAFIAAGDWH
jgi:CHAT domain-containing protein/tetratricopeptide (TPR) repeat protein